MIEPFGETVLVEVMKPEEVTKSGIIIPSQAVNKPQIGTVLAVGNGRTLDTGQRFKPEFNVGDRIVFARHAGTEVEGNLIIKDSDILAVITED
jgi:chaperonin GroES